MACLFSFFFWHFAELQLWAKTPVSPWRAAERAQSLDQCLHSGSVPKPRSTFLSTAPLSQFRPISVRIILINHLLFYFLFLVQCDGVSLLNVFYYAVLDSPSSRLPGADPQPLWTGIVIGMAVLCLLLLIVLVTVCIIGRKRSRRHRKMMRGKEPVLCHFFVPYKCYAYHPGSIKKHSVRVCKKKKKKVLLPSVFISPCHSFPLSCVFDYFRSPPCFI